MTFAINSTAATDPAVIFERVVDAAVAQGWTEEYAREDWTDLAGGTQRRVILKSVGFDSDHQIYFQLQTTSNPAAQRYGLAVRIISGYNDALTYANQDTMNKTSWSVLPLFNSEMRTWLSATPTRVNMVIQIGGVAGPAHAFQMGSMLTGVPNDEYAYPAIVGGAYLLTTETGDFSNSNGADSTARGYKYDSSSTHSLALPASNVLNNIHSSTTCIVDTDNFKYYPSSASNGDFDGAMLMPGDFFSNKASSPGGEETIYSIDVAKGRLETGLAYTLDGFGRVNGASLTPQDTITVGGTVHYVFSHPARNTNNDYFTIEGI